MKATLTSIIVAIGLSGCATMGGTTTYPLTAKFEPAEIAWSQTDGSASISGQAFFQTRGGQPRTCAGLEVMLIPVSRYAEERMQIIYKSTQQGFNSAFTGVKPKFDPDDSRYLSTARKTICDAQGNFYFNSLPAGEYFVTSLVAWVVDNPFIPQGGALMKRVEVNEEETVRIILTPDA